MKKFFASPRFVFGLVWVLTIVLFAWGWSHYMFKMRDRARELKAQRANTMVVSPVTAQSLLEKIRAPGAKLTVVNIWATWCEPCARELPAFIDLRQKTEAKGVRVLLVSADAAEDAHVVREFLTSKNALFESYQIQGNPEEFMTALQPTWTGSLPATFFFKPDGTLDSFFLGELSPEQLESKVQGALGG